MLGCDLKKQKKILDDFHLPYIHKNKGTAITGHSMGAYIHDLYPDTSIKGIRRKIKHKKVLDVGCGLNPVYKKSFMYKVNKTTGDNCVLGIDTYKGHGLTKSKNFRSMSLFRMNFHEKEMFDQILIHSFLYSWVRTPYKLAVAVKMLNKFLNPGGEIRIFPVFFGNWNMCDELLNDSIFGHFYVRCVPVMSIRQEAVKINKTGKIKTYQSFKNHQLKSCCLILKKIN